MKQNNNVDKIWEECKKALRLEESLDKGQFNWFSEMSSEKIFRVLSRRIDPLISKLSKPEIENLLSKIDDEREKGNIRNLILVSGKQIVLRDCIEKENKDLKEAVDYIIDGMDDIIKRGEYIQYWISDVVKDTENLEVWKSEMILQRAEKKKNIDWQVSKLKLLVPMVVESLRKENEGLEPSGTTLLLRRKYKGDITQWNDEFDYDILTEMEGIKRKWKHLYKQLFKLYKIRYKILCWKQKDGKKDEDMEKKRHEDWSNLWWIRRRAWLDNG